MVIGTLSETIGCIGALSDLNTYRSTVGNVQIVDEGCAVAPSYRNYRTVTIGLSERPLSDYRSYRSTVGVYYRTIGTGLSPVHPVHPVRARASPCEPVRVVHPVHPVHPVRNLCDLCIHIICIASSTAGAIK